MPRSLLARSVTLRTVAAVAALAAAVPAGGAHAESIPGVSCAGKRAPAKGESWQVFNAPTFFAPTGVATPTQEITAYAVAPSRPRLIAVSNGNSIQISNDGGCSWQQSIRLDQVPSNPNVTLSGQFTRIVGLYIAPKTNRIFAMAEELETGATVGRPHLLVNTDAQPASWRLADNGLPPIGHPLRIQAHPTKPSVMYFSFSGAREPEGGSTCLPPPVPCNDTQASTPGLLWGSEDSGESWSRRTDPGDLNGAAAIKYFSIEDDDPSGHTIWVVANGRLRKSTNSAASFTEPADLDQTGFNFTAVESINKTSANPLKIVAFGTNGRMMRQEANGQWRVSQIPFNTVESVAQRPDGDIGVATVPGGNGVTVWRIFGTDFHDYEFDSGIAGTKFRVTFGWQSITPRVTITANPQIASATAGLSTYFLRDKRRVLRFLGSSVRTLVTDAPPALIGQPPPPLGRITPGSLNLPLGLGKSQTVDYTITLPPAPTPIEVYMLIDNSGSMQPLIEDLKRSMKDVALSLVHSGVNIRMGVGQINVQPDDGDVPIDNPTTPDIDEGKPKPIYQRLRAIGPVDDAFFRALSSIDGAGGSGHEAQLESLWQSVVGDGVSPFGLGPLVGFNVPPGQQAGFSDDADVIKIIVQATDEKFSTDIRDGHNNQKDVAAALNNAHVRQIGLSQGVLEAEFDKTTGFGLKPMAKLTGAVAPRGGTDCDGDGHTDIPQGEPLVCGQNYGLDKTLVNLIKSLSDLQTIELNVSKGPTVKNVSRLTFPINAKAATKVGFTVTYSCVGVGPGVYTTDLRAGLRGISIAKAVATVTCGNPPANPPRSQAGVPPPPPPNPQPVPAPVVPANPVAQPQSQTQPQSQLNPQAGAAEQKQKQVQVALAENDIGIQDDDQLAMVGLSPDRHPVPATAVMLAGMAMASACAVSLSLRRRAQQSVVRAD